MFYLGLGGAQSVAKQNKHTFGHASTRNMDGYWQLIAHEWLGLDLLVLVVVT